MFRLYAFISFVFNKITASSQPFQQQSFVFNKIPASFAKKRILFPVPNRPYGRQSPRRDSLQ
jgi:hypothetical protein